VDPLGEPVQASLWCLVHDARHGGFGRGEEVDREGRFSIVVEHDGETWDLSAHDFSGRLATTTVAGVQPGTLDLVIQMREQRFLDLHVRSDDGHELERAGFLVGVRGNYHEPSAESPAPGRYRVAIPESAFRMEVSAPGHRTGYLGPLDPAALPPTLEVVLRRAPLLRGRVLAAGRAVPGARVELRGADPEALETKDGFRCVMSALPYVEGSSAADGRFELACDLDGSFWIRATAAGLAPCELGPLDAARLAPVTELELLLTEGGAIEGRVLAPAGSSAEGTIVAVNHGDGDPRTQRAGPDGSFRFERLAPGSWQVLAVAAEVDPSGGSYSSLDQADAIEWSCEVLPGRTTRFDLDLRAR
jgi:hypothetical protein